MVGKTAGFLFGKYLITVECHFENPAGGFYQFRFDTILFFDRFRQTGGVWIVVSSYAVFYFDFHLHPH
jgi:hypothetical protein